ncbi:MAG: asparagine synthase (glutamine-hydrolyzing) [Candidatus Omnitrophota bacterium]
MCGIVGIINKNGQQVYNSILQTMTSALRHRGPDGEGLYIDENVGLGHRRLAIIDLTVKGRQPMATEDKRFVITYNGEVYNFREIRKELEKLGYYFKSNTDSEVVLYAYAQWKEDCVKRFNGMFAFAVWDKIERKLFFARDRYGIKPLYYWQNEKVLLFASEIKAFFEHPEFKRELDHEVLLEYFTFQNTFTYKTLFKGVKILPPGNFLKINIRECIQAEQKQYWDFHFEEEKNIKSENEYLEEVDRLFNQAVKRQLVSDVEVGSYLSGGIDSGSIVAIASQHLKDFKTFCIGFDLSSASGLELSFDEREKAEHISYLYQTEHYEMVLKSGDMKRCIPNLVWALEDLRLGQCYPNFYAAKLASRFVKVCLSGCGGDELFAGYPWRYYKALRAKSFDEYTQGYYKYWQRLVPNKTLQGLFAPIWQDVNGVWTEDIFKNVFNSHKLVPQKPEDYINHSLYFEAKTFLHGLLILSDKLSMAQGLEERVPFLDNNLVDFGLKVPVKLKLKNINSILDIDEDEFVKKEKYFEKMNDGKVILRKSLRKYSGDSITNQYKQGFSGPDASWFKGESVEYVKELLMDKKANIYNFFDYKTTNNLINDHLQGKQNRRLFIWSLLNFEWWCKIFLCGSYETKTITTPNFNKECYEVSV